MGDGLDVSGGTTAVATEDLEVAASQLRRLSVEAGAVAAELASLDPLPATSADIAQARLDIEVALGRLREVEGAAHVLEGLLRVVAQNYIVGERVVGQAVLGIQTAAAQWLGSRAPGLLLASGLGGLLGAVWLGLRASGGLAPALDAPFRDAGVPGANPWVRERNVLWTNPATVGIVRRLAQLSGPFIVGALGAPIGTSLVTGTAPYEIGGRTMVAAGRSLDLLDETGVRLVESKQQPIGAPPRDYVDRLARVPYTEDGSGPQVMIERYSVEGGPDKFAVYVTGTATFSPVAIDQPWDMTSNMSNAAGLDSGSLAAVRAAMAEAGVTADTPVQLTGYSQGGGTVARLAESGLYDVRGITTFGGPTGQIPLPQGIPVVLVEHSDDLVPALGGEQSNTDAVLVRRNAFDGGEVPNRWGVPAHHLEYYLKTARLMDQSGSPQLDSTIAELDSFTEGATLESSTVYRYERADG